MEVAYILAPLLLLGVVVAAVWLDRWSVPVILVALGLGIVFGSDVLGLWYFDDIHLSNQIANAALVFILFQGGLSTKHAELRAVALPAGGLATWGVVLTAAATFGCLYGPLGWPFDRALLSAVVISSTDAAATFSILRRQSLPPRLASTIEIESAANDPMAILLTMIAVEGVAMGESQGWLVVPLLLWKIAGGAALGWLIARGATAAFNSLNPQDRGYYYVLLIGLVLLTYGLAELVHASGMLAVFTAGLTMGSRHFIYKQGIRNFSAALSTIANIGVFVMMGLLVFPHQWKDVWLDGTVLFLVLTFAARPIAVWLGTLGMRIGVRERSFMCWAGLRGAVPIVLATYPMAAGLPGGQDVFNLVFFTVLLSVSVQGSTLGALARRLGLAASARPQPRYGLELVTLAHSELDLVVVDLPGPKGRPGPRIRDLVLPSRAVITLVARGNEVVAPTGTARLLGWDQVTVLARAADEPAVRRALLEPFETTADDVEEPATRLLEPDAADSPPDADPGQMRNHVVLLGHGRVGAVLAGLLRRRRIPFVVVEQDRTISEELLRSGTPVVQGDGDEPLILDRARIASARLLLVTTADATAARLAIEHAHKANPAIEVVTRLHRDSQRALFEAFPRTLCVHGEIELAFAMARLVLQRSGVSAVETEAILMDERRGPKDGAGRTQMVEIHVPATSATVGRRLKDVALPRGALIVTIARGGEFVVPGGQTEIRAGDALLVLADPDTARAVERTIAPGTP
ncbi:MAG: potassium/proton antiporter [Planctomycetes bacterium]|nr:potassium/proton antiporter [Planctomycetota bacterium]